MKLRLFFLSVSFSVVFLSLSTPTSADTFTKDYTLTPTNPYLDTGIEVLIGDSLTIRQSSPTSAAIYVPGMSRPVAN